MKIVINLQSCIAPSVGPSSPVDARVEVDLFKRIQTVSHDQSVIIKT